MSASKGRRVGADTAEQRFLAGEITLMEAVSLFIVARRVVPESLIDPWFAALNAYDVGEINELAEPFGIHEPVNVRRRRTADLNRVSRRELIQSKVDEYHQSGLALTDPLYSNGNTAFDAVAAEFELSPNTVFDIYRGRR